MRLREDRERFDRREEEKMRLREDIRSLREDIRRLSEGIRRLREGRRSRGSSGRFDRHEGEMRLRDDRRSRGRFDRREEEEEEEKKKRRRSRAEAAMIPTTNVCVIIKEGPVDALFLLDLEDKGDGDKVLVRREPNFMFGDEPLFGCYCGLDGSIYMFDGISNPDHVTSSLNGVYRMNLWPGVFNYTKCFVDRSSLALACRMHSPKVRPASVRFQGGIVVFSTLIPYYITKPSPSPSSSDVCDFEVLRHYGYSRSSMHPLPQLRVLRDCRDCYFVLLSPDSETEGERVTPRCPAAGNALYRSSLHIVSFSVIESHNLVVGTHFGGMFSIDLDAPSAEWKVFQGSTFPLGYENFVTRDSDVVLCASGASKFSTARGKCKDNNRGVDVHFPFSTSFYPDGGILWGNSAMGLPERSTYPVCFPCVVYYHQPEWTLDIFRVDLSKFRLNKDEEEQDYKGHVQFGRRIKSFRSLNRIFGIDHIPKLVYPF